MSHFRTKAAWLFAAFLATGLCSSRTAAQRLPTDTTSGVPRKSVDSTMALPSSSLVLVTSEAVDQLRSNQLRSGVVRGQSLLLRSASTLTPAQDATGRWRSSVIIPQHLAVINSSIPFSQNYGAMWAGVGLSTRTLIGAKLESSRARFILAPEIVLSSNSDWILRHNFYVPDLPPDRSKYDLPFYVGNYTIDQPMRFGNTPIHRLDLGETTALVTGDRFAFGFSNENEWWGPGIRNAIVLSNNAPGFPHLFLRTARPLETHFGSVEARWLVGGLTESKYFDTVSTNNTRSLASVAVTLQTRWDPNLSFGFARSVYSTATGWGQVWGRWFDIFDRTNATATKKIHKDQLFSLFTRWVFPEERVEVYGEWGRLRLKPTLRDFFIAPNDTQGYTVGLQWRSDEWRGGDYRLQAEMTQLEQSATFRDGPTPSWYTSTRVIQGYTNRGEMLGAAIGPGASSQFLGVDYLKNDWRVGTFAGRIRWNEDAHDNFGFPAYAAYCNQDVSLYIGFRGARTARVGSFTGEMTIQNRLNAFFQNGGGCPMDTRLDIHNATLAFSFAPGR